MFWKSEEPYPCLNILDSGAFFQQAVNCGVFARTLAQHGVLIRQAGVESPEQIGRVEQHGGLFKAVLKRMITEHAVRRF